MQINLPGDIDPVIHSKAEAAGFGKDIGAYIAHLVASDHSEKNGNSNGENALEAFERLGLVGCIKDAPTDLATNPKHMEGFGQDDHNADPR